MQSDARGIIFFLSYPSSSSLFRTISLTSKRSFHPKGANSLTPEALLTNKRVSKHYRGTTQREQRQKTRPGKLFLHHKVPFILITWRGKKSREERTLVQTMPITGFVEMAESKDAGLVVRQLLTVTHLSPACWIEWDISRAQSKKNVVRKIGKGGTSTLQK